MHVGKSFSFLFRDKDTFRCGGGRLSTWWRRTRRHDFKEPRMFNFSATEAMKVPPKKKASQIAGSNSSVCRPGKAFARTRHWMSKSNWRQIKCLSSVLLRRNFRSSGNAFVKYEAFPREVSIDLPQIQSEKQVDLWSRKNIRPNSGRKINF